MKKALFCLFLFFPLDDLPEDRSGTPYESLITYVGQQKFKIPNQPGLTGTYIISNPGTYVLSEPIISMAATGQVISITTSNVILDLSGLSITLTSGSGSSINGITVAPNISNVTIQNGIISSMNGNGVLVGNGCLTITLEDLTISRCTVAGVQCAGTSNSVIIGCSLENCHIQQCNGDSNDTYGVKLSYSDYFTAKNCSFSTNIASTASRNCYGFYATNCKGGTIIQSNAQGNSATALATGFYLDTNCNCFLFKECIAHMNTSTTATSSGKAYGFYATVTNNSHFRKCNSIGNSAYGIAAGFYLQNCSYTSLIQCTAQNNFITGTTGAIGGFGFISDTASCEGNIFDQCNASSNKGSTLITSVGCGFSLDNSLCCTIKNCFSQFNDGTNGAGIGIYLRTGVTRCCIQNNTIIANTSSAVSKAYGIWDTSNPSTTLMSGNFAFGNRDETLTPVNQNYVVTYTFGTGLQSTTKNSLKTLNIPTFANTDITP
jgi:parallel beta-helix repeat protein